MRVVLKHLTCGNAAFDTLALMIAYLREVLGRFKLQLGGSSLTLILAGIAEHLTGRSISWSVYIGLLAVCFVTTLLLLGSEQYKALQPRNEDS